MSIQNASIKFGFDAPSRGGSKDSTGRTRVIDNTSKRTPYLSSHYLCSVRLAYFYTTGIIVSHMSLYMSGAFQVGMPHETSEKTF